MSSAAVERLRNDLMHGQSVWLKRRRGIIGCSLFSSAVLGGIGLFQVGVLKRLPGLPGETFDAQAVHGSTEAYAHVATPDAFLGLLSYSATACLAAMGSEDRWETHRWMPVAMGAKTLADASMAMRLGVIEIKKLRKLSVWSLLVSAATVVSLCLAVPEVSKVFTTGRHQI